MMCEERFRHYSFGIPKLDDDHWHAFKLMDSMLEDLRTKQYDQADAGLDLLLEYVKKHNESEMRMMAEVNYPYAQWHQESNKKIIVLATHLKEQIGKNHVNRYQIQNFENAVLQHIDHEDRKLADFIKAKA